jgi:hypothetical protein
MKRSIFFLFLIFQAFVSFSQSVLTGAVVDAEDNKPVPYVSIGITSKPNGTVSNTAGIFSLTLDNTVNNSDTLKFSSIGYHDKAFLVGEFKEKLKAGTLTIALTKAVNELKQVSVTAKKATVKIVGYQTNSKLLSVGFASNNLGSQGGIIIPIKHPETNLENLSFLVVQNSFKHLAFRMNLYEMVNDKPGNNILSENIIISIDNMQTGKITFDLAKYNLYLNKDVLMTLEWIEAQPASNGHCAVATSLFGHTYFRQASQSPWVKKSTGLGISVKTSY